MLINFVPVARQMGKLEYRLPSVSYKFFYCFQLFWLQLKEGILLLDLGLLHDALHGLGDGWESLIVLLFPGLSKPVFVVRVVLD